MLEKTKKPLVSVIIRTSFARRGCLEEAINSIENQTYQNIELVIVENGSHKLHLWLEEKLVDLNCIVSYYHILHANRCLAGNLGMKKAKGELLCFLDDDDLFYPQHLDILIKALINNITICAAYSISHEVPSYIKSHTPFEYNDQKKKIIFKRKFNRGALFINNYIPIQTIVFKKELFLEYGGFDINLNNLEDWNLWVKFASKRNFLFVNKVTSMYRVPSSIDAIIARDTLLDKYYPLARQKQKNIKILLDMVMLKEIFFEIMRPCIVASFFYKTSYYKINSTFSYQNFCIQNHVDLEKEKKTLNVLDAIYLANAIIVELKFIWFIIRFETWIKKNCNLSILKRFLRS